MKMNKNYGMSMAFMTEGVCDYEHFCKTGAGKHPEMGRVEFILQVIEPAAELLSVIADEMDREDWWYKCHGVFWYDVANPIGWTLFSTEASTTERTIEVILDCCKDGIFWGDGDTERYRKLLTDYSNYRKLLTDYSNYRKLLTDYSKKKAVAIATDTLTNGEAP